MQQPPTTAPGQPLATVLLIMEESIMQLSPVTEQLILDPFLMILNRARERAVNEWILTGELTGQLIIEAREWIMDCLWADLEREDIDALTDAAITRGIARHFDGGLVEFVRSGL